MHLIQSFNPLSGLNKFYSPKSKPHHPGSYQEYFQTKIKYPIFQQKDKTNPNVVNKHHHMPNKVTQNQSTYLIKYKRSKLSKMKSNKHKRTPSKPKKTKQDYKINPMYASKISQMLSQISIPTNQQKITKKQLRQLQNKIMTEILALRQQKIFALQDLNKIVDKKNKAVQLIKGYQVLKQAQRLNQDEDQPKNSKLSTAKYESYQSPISKQYKDSRLSKKSSYPAELMNSKISNQVNQMQSAFAEAIKIKEQLMRPLIEHPLILKNTELKAELEQLKEQFQSSHQNKSSINEQITFYKSQNQKLTQQLEKQRLKLSSLEHQRFETFFPKDKQKIDQMRRLIDIQRELQLKKQQLEESLLNGTIIRKAQDQLIIEELKQQNRQLLLNCQRLQMNSIQDPIDEAYNTMSVEQLQDLVERQMQNKSIFDQLMNQFKDKISDIQRQNENMKKRKTRVSYYY